MTELNFSRHVNESMVQSLPRDEALKLSLREGFQAGAGHVHTVVSAILFLYLAQGVVYLIAYLVDFGSEEKKWEFYSRLSTGFSTGRFLMVLLLFEKTLFTFVVKPGGA